MAGRTGQSLTALARQRQLSRAVRGYFAVSVPLTVTSFVVFAMLNVFVVNVTVPTKVVEGLPPSEAMGLKSMANTQVLAGSTNVLAVQFSLASPLGKFAG